MSTQNRLREILPKWLDKTFSIGKVDCLQLLWDLYPELPHEHNEFKEADYVRLWRNDRARAIEELDDYIRTHFDIIPSGEIKLGDLVFLLDPLLYGIYLGNNKVLTILEEKGSVVLGINNGEYFTFRYKGEQQSADSESL